MTIDQLIYVLRHFPGYMEINSRTIGEIGSVRMSKDLRSVEVISPEQGKEVISLNGMSPGERELRMRKIFKEWEE